MCRAIKDLMIEDSRFSYSEELGSKDLEENHSKTNIMLTPISGYLNIERVEREK
jgi:hypothetical protein